jgi:uncharacterized protein YggU (UPF0235/DUF167 family)
MQGKLTISVYVLSRASSSEIGGVRNERLIIKTKAVPRDGQTNRDVTVLLAKACKVPKTRVLSKTGVSSRNKTFHVERPVHLPEWLTELCYGGKN